MKKVIIKCEVCNKNHMDCERKQFGYKGKFYMVCKECQEEMKLTSKVISITAKWIVNKKPEEYAIFAQNGKIFGVTPLVSTT
jgi:hypothetical protein